MKRWFFIYHKVMFGKLQIIQIKKNIQGKKFILLSLRIIFI